MPGISLMFNVTNSKNRELIKPGQKLFLDASKSILYKDSYKREILLKEDSFIVICTRYPEYPVQILDNKEFWVCIEGKFYGKNDSKIEYEVLGIIEDIFRTNLMGDKDKKRVIAWLLETDGDFVIYALNKSNKDFFIMNDLLGRLPFYYIQRNDSELIASREIQLMSMIQNYQGDGNKFDMMGIAQLLMFSHTVGMRTLLKEVNRLQPASLVRISNDNSESKMKIHNLHVFNFENKQYADRTIKENVKELVSLFSEACRNRVDDKVMNLISLSGGFDSRAIAMSLSENDIPYYAITSPEPNWKPVMGTLSETEIAERLAKVLNIKLEKYDAMKPQAKDLVMILKSKNGLIYLGHGFLIRLLEEIRNKHPTTPINFFTGHGGDISFSDLSSGVEDIDDCVRTILNAHGQFRLNEIMSLTNIKKTEFKDEIKKILSTYPEEKPAQKLIHYLFFEVNAKFSFEIEDMNRFYFWTVCPFYSVPFFKYIFNCSDESKRRLDLYRDFLLTISPEVAAINNSDWGSSITSKRFKIYQYVFYLSTKYRIIWKLLTKLSGKRGYSGAYDYNSNSPIIRCLMEQVNTCNSMSNFLSSTAIKKILSNATDYTYVGIDNLFTIASLLEKNLCKKSAINKYF